MTDDQGSILAKPEAVHDNLQPDCHSPVLVGGRLFGAANGLYCLDADQQLDELWRNRDREFREYVSLIASGERVLATTLHGTLILFKVDSDRFEKLGEMSLLDDEAGLYSHPAIVGSNLYVRGTRSLVCLELTADSQPH